MKVVSTWIFTLPLTACVVPKDEVQETYAAQIGIVNHTDQYIYATHIDNSGGGHAGKFSAGVANMCCGTLPAQWHPGLKFSVRWDMPEGIRHVWKERLVEVERYDEPGSVYLHFFANDEVRIVVTQWAGGAQEHPIPSPPRKDGTATR